MAGVQDQLEIRFRLTDGSDIGPKTFPAATSVATLKESILSQWPKEKENGPRTVKDVKLISAGKILENNRTIGECQSPLLNVPGAVTTMHVIVQPPSLDKVIWLSNRSRVDAFVQYYSLLSNGAKVEAKRLELVWVNKVLNC